MSSPNLPLVHSHHPTTFLERGVAVPFTTPALLGARARPADRGGIELIVPSPSGGRGVYILLWGGVCRICRPTVHDTRLYQQIAETQGITPSSMRAAARAVASQGLAGHDAAAAARLADVNETRDRLATNFLLMVAAVRQTDPDGGIDEAEVLARHPALRQRAKYSLQRLAPLLCCDAGRVFSSLEQLAVVLTPIGLDRQDPPARVPRLLTAIARFRAEATAWARGNPDDTGARASMAATIAGVTVTCTELTLADARASTEPITDLLREWIAAPEPVAARLARSEWLVDGWEQICALWSSATTKAARRVALMELSLMVPILPKEVAGWLSRQVDTDVTRYLARIVPQHIDWRTGIYFDIVKRNEYLRAFAA